MKKMLFICMVGSLFFLTSVATAEEVVSENIVGYQQRVGRSTFDMVGCVFTPITNSTGSTLFSKLVTGDFKDGDQAQFLRPTGGYNILVYYVGGLFVPGVGPGQTGWGNTSGIQTDVNLIAGTAFWMNTDADYFIQAGQVQIAENNKLTAPGGDFFMFSSPYPADCKLSQIKFTGLKNLDQVQFLRPTGGYNILVYYVGGLFIPGIGPGQTGWGNTSGIQADADIASGEGFWINAVDEVKVEFPVPAYLF